MAVKTTKMPSALRKDLAELEDAIKVKEEIIGKLEMDSPAYLTIKGEIAELQEALQAIERELEKKETEEERLRKKNSWKKEKSTVDEILEKYHIGYIIPEDKFIYCLDLGSTQNNAQFNMINSSRIIRLLNKMSGVTISGKDYHEIIDHIESKNRSFYTVTSSFNNAKWDESNVYNKMSVIRNYWIQPDYDNADKYNRYFDLLMEAVAGGKQENIEHLEKWIGYKYLHPSNNANIPNIDMGGNPGGNGKGTLVEILKTIFTPACVIQAHREELDKFNGNWEMAVILYYDEPEEKELAASKLKQATGAEDMRVEKKGIDATMADRNYNFVFLSNNEKGVVKLSGGSDGGEDRRYSVITTNVVLYDLFRDAGFDDDEAKQELNKIRNTVYKNRNEVARWLAHIIKKHDIENIGQLPALHGEDYNKRFDEQKDAITEAFDKILPVFQKNQCINAHMLHELVVTLTENTSWKIKNVNERFQKYLTRNKIDNEIKSQCSIKILWKGEEQERLQQQTVVIKGSANLSFEYSSISILKWKKGMKDLNVLNKDTIAL
jgi:hypothetical protein